MQQITERLGAPKYKMKMGNREILSFDGGDIIFQNGIVTESHISHQSHTTQNTTPHKSHKIPDPVAAKTKQETLFRYGLNDKELNTFMHTTIDNSDWSKAYSILTDEIIKEVLPLENNINNSSVNKLLSNQAVFKSICQVNAITRITPQVLERFSKEPNATAFLRWFFGKTQYVNLFITSIKPEDHVEKVLLIWMNLWANDIKGRDKYSALALSCALVFDDPVSIVMPLKEKGESVNVLERYTTLKNLDTNNQLKIHITTLAPYEIVWIVDAPVSNSELLWTRNRTIHIPRANWITAYNMVPYRLDMLDNMAKVYKTKKQKAKSFMDIVNKGGICADQALFASVSAKANGIPAMQITGIRQGVAHAWLGFKQADNMWNLEAGGSGYSNAFITDPQSHKRFSAQDAYLIFDPQQKTEEYIHTSNALLLAMVLANQNKVETAQEILNASISTGIRNIDAWNSLFLCVQSTTKSATTCSTVAQRMIKTFRGYPNMISRADEWEAARIDELKGAAAAVEIAEAARQAMKKNYPLRSDLIFNSLIREASYMKKAHQNNEALKLYKQAVLYNANNSRSFMLTTNLYFEMAKTTGQAQSAARYIDRIFTQFYADPRGKAGIYRKAYTTMLRHVADFFKQAGMQREYDWRITRAHNIDLSI